MKRDSAIDIARGIAILLVIFGHCKYIFSPIKVWLYSFHMPLFFTISGMLFNYEKYKNDFNTFIKSRIKGLIVPYIFLSLVMWVIVALLRIIKGFIFENEIVIASKTLKQFIGIFVGFRLTDYYFSLWFLLVLFFSEIVMFFIIKLISKIKIDIKITILSISIIMLIISYIEFFFIKGFYFSIDLIPIALTFLLLGYLFRFINIKKYLNAWIMPVSLILNIVFCYFNYKMFGLSDLYNCNIGNPLLFCISAISGIVFSLAGSKIISNNILLEYIGKNSIIFYAFQNSIALPIATFIIVKGFSIIKFSNNFVLFVSIIFLALLILMFISYIINNYFPILIGKQKKEMSI